MLAAISLQLRIGADAWDGLDQLHRLPAAKANDWMPWFVSGLFGGGHVINLKLKFYTFSIPDFYVRHKPSPSTNPD